MEAIVSVIIVPTDNNPQKVLSRLFHRNRGEYFKSLTESHFKSFMPAITIHLEKCRHPFCMEIKEEL